MYRSLTIAALVVALSAAASGQSKGQRLVPGKAEQELIAMSHTYVETGLGKDMVVATDEVTRTPSGLMGVAEVKGRWDSVELEMPVVRVGGGEAVVTGRVRFKGRSLEERVIDQASGVKIRYVREKGGWKFVSLCLGTCGVE